MKSFIMLIGPSYSGKSSFIEQTKSRLEEEDSVEVVSSDAIREELYGDASIQTNPKRVFEIVHSRILKSTADVVIMDATNLQMKNRKAILDKIPTEVEKTAIVFAQPWNVLMERRDKRKTVIVPKEVLYRQICKFEMPLKSEGFNFIYLYEPEKTISAFEFINRMDGFNQKNPYHKHTLDIHCALAAEYILEKTNSKEMYWATLFHDVGKLYTQVFNDGRGKPTKEAHYFSHGNYGAYLMLCMDTTLIGEINKELMATLINYHMEPYNATTEKALARRVRRFGTELWDKIMLLHEADRYAH